MQAKYLSSFPQLQWENLANIFQQTRREIISAEAHNSYRPSALFFRLVASLDVSLGHILFWVHLHWRELGKMKLIDLPKVFSKSEEVYIVL